MRGRRRCGRHGVLGVFARGCYSGVAGGSGGSHARGGAGVSREDAWGCHRVEGVALLYGDGRGGPWKDRGGRTRVQSWLEEPSRWGGFRLVFRVARETDAGEG